MRITSVLIFLVSGCLTLAAGPEAWRDRSIYQLLTDRYARTDGSTTASCASNFQGFCGGTWKGIQNHLDYIQVSTQDERRISTNPWSEYGIRCHLDQSCHPASSGPNARVHRVYANQPFWYERQLWDATRSAVFITRFEESWNGKFIASGRLLAIVLTKGKLLMVDIVVNHFGAPGPASSVNYGWMNPFSQQSLFHPVCWITDNDYATHDQNMLNCWLGNEQYPVPDGELDSTLRMRFY